VDEDTLVVVDGAYMEYAKAKDSAYLYRAKRYPKALKMRYHTGTFSKAMG